jgi:glucoamylase
MGIGRIWPIFTGERGHYEIALGNKADKYIKCMEAFANEGYILPEQVWEDTGEPTGSATPLAWSHAEYVRLVASSYLGRVSDTPSCVYNRYVLGNKNL